MTEYHRHYFGKREIRKQPSKKLVFPNVCPGCGKTIRRSSKNKVGNLCKKCRPGYKQSPELMASSCKQCTFEVECTIRVHLGIWVICETPDYGDLQRLIRNVGSYSDDLQEVIELAMVQKCSRNLIENSISQNAPVVYQEIVDGIIPQMSIGIQELESVGRLR